MRQALLDSATFRRLAVAIHETDGIIYVRRGRCGGQVVGDLDAATCAYGDKEAWWFENDGKGKFTNHLVARDRVVAE